MNESLFDWYFYGSKIPRKIKKKMIGKKMGRGKLRRLLNSVVIGEPTRTMYETPNVTPYLFCPKCGEPGYVGGGNKTEYPEHWEDFKCLRCRTVVGYIDNSPFIHALQCKDNNYDPTF